MIPALISQVKGLAVLDYFDKYVVLDIHKPSEPYLADGQTVARLLSNATDIEAIEVLDMSALQTHLEIRKNREELLFAALILLDGERSENVRQEAAKAVALSRDEWDWVEGVLMSTPLPLGSDVMGAARFSNIRSSFFVELLSLQSRIKTLQLAWNALPNHVFIGEDRKQTHARLVRQGVFRNLLTIDTNRSATPFTPALKAFSSSLAESDTSFSSPHSTAKSVGLFEHQGEKPAPAIWTTSPWRTSWLKSEWPKIESTLACEAAASWIDHIVPVKKFHESNMFAGTFDKIFDSWDVVRNDVAISEPIDLIYHLSGKLADTKITRVELKGSTAAGKTIVKVQIPPGYSKISRFVEERKKSIRNLILDFFGLSALDASITDDFVKDIFHHSLTESESNSLRMSTIHEAQLAFDTRIPFDFRENSAIDGRAEGKRVPLSSTQSEQHQLYIDALRKIFSIYALDKKFSLGGGVLFVPEAISTGRGASHTRASLSNFNTKKFSWFEGYSASILDSLQKRLVTDLKSGLPAEYCGWITLEKLRSTIDNLDTLGNAVDGIQKEISNAGFSPETVQLSSDRLRLNPDFTAASNIGISSAFGLNA